MFSDNQIQQIRIPTAFFTDCNTDIEYTLEALCPGHCGMAVCRHAVVYLTVLLTLVAGLQNMRPLVNDLFINYSDIN